ncbi:hypothetical protein [Pseudomonas guariconensis]|uniref:hypothetical protein n=1 Tax=Pseudomonas guariconensis TaxID=1288410 RepID=UPI002B05B492|nr:hypothetical protein [Pseudomonas guariconensis]
MAPAVLCQAAHARLGLVGTASQGRNAFSRCTGHLGLGFLSRLSAIGAQLLQLIAGCGNLLLQDIGALSGGISHGLTDDAIAGGALLANTVDRRAGLPAFVRQGFGTVLPRLAQVTLQGLDFPTALPSMGIDMKRNAQI